MCVLMLVALTYVLFVVFSPKTSCLRKRDVFTFRLSLPSLKVRGNSFYLIEKIKQKDKEKISNSDSNYEYIKNNNFINKLEIF